MIVRDASDDDIRHVCRVMRPHNARELAATREIFDPTAFADDVIEARPVAIQQLALCSTETAPVAILAAYLTGPRSACVFLVATPEWPAIAQAAFRFMAKAFIPAVLVPHVNVAETDVLDDPAWSRAWLVRLGFAEHGPPVPRGRRGEGFVRMVWRNDQAMIDAAAAALASR